MFPYSAPDNTVVKIHRSGICAFSVSQTGNEKYNATQGTTSIEIYAVAKPTPTKPGAKPAPAPRPQKPRPSEGLQILSGSSSTSGGSKAGTSASGGGVAVNGKITIVCVKNGVNKKITDKNPKCPKGYSQK